MLQDTAAILSVFSNALKLLFSFSVQFQTHSTLIRMGGGWKKIVEKYIILPLKQNKGKPEQAYFNEDQSGN